MNIPEYVNEFNIRAAVLVGRMGDHAEYLIMGVHATREHGKWVTAYYYGGNKWALGNYFETEAEAKSNFISRWKFIQGAIEHHS